MKRILILVRRTDKGGAEMLESRLAAQLSSRGYEVYLGAQYGERDFQGNEKRLEWMMTGIKDVFFLASNKRAGILRATVKLIGWQKRLNFDVIISSNTGLATIACIARWFSKFVHITAFHDYLTEKRLRSLRLFIWRKLLPGVDHAYAITDYVRQNMVHFVPALERKTTVVYNSLPMGNGPDEEIDIRDELKLDPKTKLLLYVGRLNYRKGLDLVIDYTAQHLKDWNAVLLIAGEQVASKNLDYGRMNYTAMLDKKVMQKDSSDRIFFLGYRKDVFSIMRQSDALMHLARHEGFGLILVEAFKARLPIVASNVGGIPEVLQQTGYPQFDISDVVGVVEETHRLLKFSKSERNRYTEEAFKRVSFFSDERRADDVQQILEKCLDQ